MQCNEMGTMIDIEAVKFAANGRWVEILCALGGIPMQSLDGRHHPCPKCGGTDRFRMIDEESGALYCNKCLTNCGDGIGALIWLLDCDFKTAIGSLSSYLGVGDDSGAPRVIVDVVTEVARRKRMPIESFKAFGAHEAVRGEFTVARVPMYDEMREVCSSFDMAYGTGEPRLEKGMCGHGTPAGLFVATWPKAGDLVLLTEGVKDAAKLHSLGYLAIGLPGADLGAKFSRLFAGCRVIIVPDRDTTGEEKARLSAARLSGIADSVRIASLPGEIKVKDGDGVREVCQKKNGERMLRQAIDDAAVWTVSGEEKAKPHIRLVQGINAFLDKVEAGEGETYKCGIPEIDASIGGVAPGEVVVIAARPSHGKSFLSMQWLDNFALAGHPGAMMSEEMPIDGLARRAVCFETTVPEEDWRKNMKQVRFDVNAHHAERQDVFVVEYCVTIQSLVNEIDRAVGDHGVKIVAVDYVQLLKSSRSKATLYDDVTEASSALKRCAGKNKIVLLELAQLGRDIDKRAERAPKMSDLKQSGQIEQDADVILFLQWPWKDDPTFPRKEEYLIYVGKNRNRGTVSPIISTRFNPARQRLQSDMAASNMPDDF